jgi:hypothetical protein
MRKPALRPRKSGTLPRLNNATFLLSFCGLDPPLYHLLAKHLGGRREQCESMGRARCSDFPLSYVGSTNLRRRFTIGNAGSRCHPLVIVSTPSYSRIGNSV